MTKRIETMLLLNKKPGHTPLQTIKEFKLRNPEYTSKTLSYAGRLDPMAEGLLLVLVGDENKKRHIYEHLPKIYEFTILVGFSTDSYDVMGTVTKQSTQQLNTISFDRTLQSMNGRQILSLPPYSSKPVNGKPLYWYAKKNLLHTISLPTQQIEIQSLIRTDIKTLSAKIIRESILQRISLVNGNFRQEEIQNQWKMLLSNDDSLYEIICCKLEASTGTYVRSIVNTISNTLSIPLLTYSIKRIAIGQYTLTE